MANQCSVHKLQFHMFQKVLHKLLDRIWRADVKVALVEQAADANIEEDTDVVDDLAVDNIALDQGLADGVDVAALLSN